MKKRKFLTVLLCLSLLASAFYIVLAASPGSNEDPLVTMSYLNDVLKPALKQEIKSEIGSSGTGQGGYVVVELEAGKTLISTDSAEVVLRTGTAECVSPYEDNGLADMTTGEELFGGQQLVKNHQYLISRGDGRGIHASEFCYDMVRGAYTIS